MIVPKGLDPLAGARNRITSPTLLSIILDPALNRKVHQISETSVKLVSEKEEEIVNFFNFMLTYILVLAGLLAYLLYLT